MLGKFLRHFQLITNKIGHHRAAGHPRRPSLAVVSIFNHLSVLFWCFERSDFDPFPTKSAAGDPRRPSLAVVSGELCSGAAAPPKRRRCYQNSYRGFRCPNFPTYVLHCKLQQAKAQEATQYPVTMTGPTFLSHSTTTTHEPPELMEEFLMSQFSHFQQIRTQETI